MGHTWRSLSLVPSAKKPQAALYSSQVLNQRFSNTDTGVIKATTIVDHALWPSKDKKDKFGDKEVTYVVKHYEGSFLRAGVAVNSVEFEWTLLKNNLYSEPEEVKNLA